MKKYLNKLVKIKLRGKKPVSGIIIDYNRDWILMKSNPVDYIIDGYFVIRKKHIASIERGEAEKWTEKVINLKKLSTPAKARIPLDNLETILKALTKKYGVFTVYTKEEGVCWLGRLKMIDDERLIIDDLSTRGTWDGQMEFKVNEIREIEFDTDYINSLKLVLK